MECPICICRDSFTGPGTTVSCPDCDAKIDVRTGRVVDTERESRVHGPHCDSRIGMSSK